MNLKLNNVIKYRTAPLQPNKWFFESFNGDYSDSPKALSVFLHETHPDIIIVWGYKSGNIEVFPEYIKTVQIGTSEYYSEKGSSGVVITNGMNGGTSVKCDYGLDWIKLRIKQIMYYKAKQRVFSTWHGTILKRIGRDQIGNENRNGFATNPFIMFAGNRHTLEILRHLTYGKVRIEGLGCPRNDALFLNDYDLKKSELDLAGKKIVLFAPTFRNDGSDVSEKNIYRSGLNQLSEINLDVLLNTLHNKFGGEWVFICRFHYHVSKMVDWNEIKRRYGNKIVNGNLFDDMVDYLSCADVLLSDISSCITDFALTKKPVFLYFPDKKHYEEIERGFYIPIEELPFSIAEKPDELIENIEMFDYNIYLGQVNELNNRLGVYDDGHACERIVDYIISNSKSK